MENIGTVVSATRVKIYYENGTVLELNGEAARNLTQILFNSNPNIHKLNWKVSKPLPVWKKLTNKIIEILP